MSSHIMGKPYKEGTTLKDILEDGWSRGFTFPQTQEECEIMGYKIDKDEIEIFWNILDRSYWYNQRDRFSYTHKTEDIFFKEQIDRTIQ